MATVTGLTADRMLEIEAASVVDGKVVSGDLILTKHDGTTIDAGSVIGPPGPQGPQGLVGIPGEVKLWPGDTLPTGSYGTWVWADGAAYPVTAHPLAAASIAAQWRTFGGVADPGAPNFRVPDLRGLVPAGLDQMPGGTRANRMVRAEAIVLAMITGEEKHKLVPDQMPIHNHGRNVAGGPSEGGVVSVGGSISPGAQAVNGGAHAHGASGGGGFATTNQTRNLRTDGSSAYSIITAAQNTDTHTGHVHSLSGSITGTGTIDPKGGDIPHENVQPTVFVPYIVCLDG